MKQNSNSKKFVFVCLCLLLCLPAISTFSSAQAISTIPTSWYCSGTVSSSTGGVLSDVTVKLYGYSTGGEPVPDSREVTHSITSGSWVLLSTTTTNPNGYYYVSTFAYSDKSSMRVDFSKTGYYPTTYAFSSSPGSHTYSPTLVKVPTVTYVTVSGKVEDFINRPITDAIVKLSTTGGTLISSTVTNSVGAFSMSVVKTAVTRVLTVSHSQYFPDETLIENSISRTANFKLKACILDYSVVSGSSYFGGALTHDIDLYYGRSADSSENYLHIPEWIQDSSFLLSHAQYDSSESVPAAFSSVAFRALDYDKNGLDSRDLDFALDIRPIANIGDPLLHGTDGYMRYLMTTPESVSPPVLDRLEVSMQIKGTIDDGDSVRIEGAASSQKNYLYENMNAPEPGTGVPNLIDDPHLNDLGFWSQYNPSSGNSITVDGKATLVNNDDGKVYIAEKYITSFPTPERYLTAYFEGRRGTSYDSGTTVGLDLRITLSNGEVKWYMPSELRMGRYDTLWDEHYVFLDAVATYGYPISQVRAYLLNYEKCTALMDYIYVGATYWDLSTDPNNPEQSISFEDWRNEQVAVQEFEDTVDTVATVCGVIGTVTGYLPIPHAKAIGWAFRGASILLNIRRLLLDSDSDGSCSGTIQYPSHDGYRPATAQSTILGSLELDASSTGEQILEIRIKNYFEFGDDYISDAGYFIVEEIINIHLLDQAYSV